MALQSKIPNTNRSLDLLYKYVFGENAVIPNNIELTELSRDATTSSITTFLNTPYYNLYESPDSTIEFENSLSYRPRSIDIWWEEFIDRDNGYFDGKSTSIVYYKNDETDLNYRTNKVFNGKPYTFKTKHILRTYGLYSAKFKIEDLFYFGSYTEEDLMGDIFAGVGISYIKYNLFNNIPVDRVIVRCVSKVYKNNTIVAEDAQTFDASFIINRVITRSDNDGSLCYTLNNITRESGEIEILATDDVYRINEYYVSFTSDIQLRWWYTFSWDDNIRGYSDHYEYMFYSFAHRAKIKDCYYKKESTSSYVVLSSSYSDEYKTIIKYRPTGTYYSGGPYENNDSGQGHLPGEEPTIYTIGEWDNEWPYPNSSITISDESKVFKGSYRFNVTDAIYLQNSDPSLHTAILSDYDVDQGWITYKYKITTSNFLDSTLNLNTGILREWCLYSPDGNVADWAEGLDWKEISRYNRLKLLVNIIYYKNSISENNIIKNDSYEYNSSDDLDKDRSVLNDWAYNRYGYTSFVKDTISSPINIDFNIIYLVIKVKIEEYSLDNNNRTVLTFRIPGGFMGAEVVCHRKGTAKITLNPVLNIPSWGNNNVEKITNVLNGSFQAPQYIYAHEYSNNNITVSSVYNKSIYSEVWPVDGGISFGYELLDTHSNAQVIYNL